MTGLEQLIAWVVGIAAALGAIGVIAKTLRDFGRWVRRRFIPWARRAIRLVDDLTGLPEAFTAHLDVAARDHRLLNSMARDLGVLPEVAAAVADVRAEVKNNGGGSLKDSTHRIERALGLPEPTARPHTGPTPCLPKEP